MKEYLLGIDIGTTNVKAGIFTTDGDLVSQGSASYPIRYPGLNMAEQNPEDWWMAVKKSMQRMLENMTALKPYRILALSVSSQTPSLTALDESGRVIRNAMIWMDRRAEEELKEIVDSVGYDLFRQITGAVPDAFYLLPKLYWYKKHEPDNFRRTKCILQANGYVNYRLTDQLSMDASSAGLTLCTDIRDGKYSRRLEEAAGLSFDSVFPMIYENWEVIGEVTEKASEELGIPKGIPVAAGTTDTIAAVLSFGLSKPGEAAEITGTSTLAFFAHDKKLTDSGKLMQKQSPFANIPSILNAPINATGASVKWYLDNIGINKEEAEGYHDVYEVFSRYADQAGPGAGGLIYFPYMMGERAPLWNSYAKGMFIGMTLDTTYKEIARAILEGTSYALRHVCDEYRNLGGEPECFRVSGGGAENRLWLEIKASVLGLPILVPDEKCGNAILGDALLAGKAAGLYQDLGKVSREIVKIKKVIEPNPRWTKVYDQLYPYYRSMYGHLAGDLSNLECTIKQMTDNGWRGGE